MGTVLLGCHGDGSPGFFPPEGARGTVLLVFFHHSDRFHRLLTGMKKIIKERQWFEDGRVYYAK